MSTPLSRTRSRRSSISEHTDTKTDNTSSSTDNNIDNNTVTSSGIVILVTGFVLSSDEISALESMGAKLIESPLDSPTHLVVDKVRRTDKFLNSYTICDYVLRQEWITRSIQKGQFQPEKSFQLTDNEAEKKWKFSLKKRQQYLKIFESIRFYVTKSVKIPVDTLKNFVNVCGGELSQTQPKKFDDGIIVISSEEDTKTNAKLLKMGYTIYSHEIILTGVLRQKLEREQHIIAQP